MFEKTVEDLQDNMKKRANKCCEELSNITNMATLFFKFMINRSHCFGMESAVYRNELTKYMSYFRENDRDPEVYRQIRDFVSTPLQVFSDRLILDDNECVPTLIVVVKNELDRMKLFMEHYRRLGVRQFIIVDNDSTDGTREYLAKQPGTRVYLVEEPFQTQKKQAWIEKVLAITGYNRWYIVVDSDELLDYVGSETHSIEELIKHQKKKGKIRLQGYMVDMYSEAPLFALQCSYEKIPQVFLLFDKNSYAEEKPNKISGGPRSRLFGLKMLLSKQSIFYFLPEMIYANSHYVYLPGSKSYEENVFVIKHYKFFESDRAVYEDHVKKGNYYNGSQKYKVIMSHINKAQEVSCVYDQSAIYETSESLKQLPFLNWTDWAE